MANEEVVPHAPQPFPSWTLNTETRHWIPPVPYPSDNKNYIWDEDAQKWLPRA